MTCYGSYMTQRRGAGEAPKQTSQETARRGDVAALTSSFENGSVRDLIVAGGLRGFTVDEMFPEVTR